MRKFNKEHNNLQWLFPDPMCNTESNSELWYDMYEAMAESLFEAAHGFEENFEKDDLIDAFMKGASVAHSKMANMIANYQQRCMEAESRLGYTLDSNKQLMNLITELTKHINSK